jgi:hypothetical protein
MNDPFFLLPANLANLSRVAGEVTTRYCLSGVRVEVCENDYEVAATDGRALAVVYGVLGGDPLSYPTSAELADLPPSADSAVIPCDAWRDRFRKAGKQRPDEPGSGLVAVHLQPAASTLATAGDAGVEAEHVTNLSGRFPDYDAVIPRKDPVVRMHLDADYLLELVRLAKEFGPGREQSHRITLDVYESGKPIVLRSQNERAQEFVGLVMPLTQ